MKTLIIYAHPYEGSFNNHVLKVVTEKLQKQGKSVDLIDLNEDGFNPVMTKGDLRLFSRGEYADPLAEDYVKRLKESDEIVFIFPIWWYSMPAIMKGFLDKVLLKGHTYVEENYQMVGVLKNKKATVLTTSTITEDYFKMIGDPINNLFIKGTLGAVGIHDVKWISCAPVFSEEARNEYIKKIEEHFK